jgi:hypothetical protein
MLMEFDLEVDGEWKKYELLRWSNNGFDLKSGASIYQLSYHIFNANTIEIYLNELRYRLYLSKNTNGLIYIYTDGFYFQLKDPAILQKMDFLRKYERWSFRKSTRFSHARKTN